LKRNGASVQIPSYAQPLAPWLKWGLPAAIFLYPAILIIPACNWEAGINREYGLIESLSNLFLLVALGLAIFAWKAAASQLQRVWVILFGFGCFIFLGEEISWGQHYMKWAPPENWSEINRQNETNLHNIKGLPELILGRIARNGLSIGLIVGAVVVPWCLRMYPAFCQPGGLNYWIWPSSQTGPLAILAVASNIPKRFMKNLNMEIPWQYYGPNDGELKECLFALFLMLYALVLLRTFRSRVDSPAGAKP
jgi:hypothetical protein